MATLKDNDEYYLFAQELKSQGHSMGKIEKELRLNNLDDAYIQAIKRKLAGIDRGGSTGIKKHFTPYMPLEQGDVSRSSGSKPVNKPMFTWRTLILFTVLYFLIKALIRWILV